MQEMNTDEIIAIVKKLEARQELEQLGKALSLEQLLKLLDSTLQIEGTHHWKLSPILVGIPHTLFGKLTQLATKKQMHIINHESMTESVQHHVTMLSHEMKQQLEENIDSAEKMLDEIGFLNLHETTLEQVSNLKKRIETFSGLFESLIERSNPLLTLAWNGSRIDLIESLNYIKRSAASSIELLISDLNKKVEEHFLRIYGTAGDIEAVKEDEPAVEGLAKFSVWYLKDYWELGLLPGVEKQTDLDIDMEKHSETERAEYRAKLFKLARDTLSQIGLNTVKDLKAAFIFSRATLQEHIEKRRLRLDK